MTFFKFLRIAKTPLGCAWEKPASARTSGTFLSEFNKLPNDSILLNSIICQTNVGEHFYCCSLLAIVGVVQPHNRAGYLRLFTVKDKFSGESVFYVKGGAKK